MNWLLLTWNVCLLLCLKSANGGNFSTCHTVGFEGRMGNLMFEYAALVGVCTVKQLDYRTCAFLSIPGWTFWPVNEFVREFNLPKVSTVSCAIDMQVQTTERWFAFDPAIFTTPPNSVLRGWLQSWKYFHPHAGDTVRKIFTIPQEPAKQAAVYIDNIRSQLPVGYKLLAVHVRVGDKIHDPKFLTRYDQWSLSESYYRKAITLLHARHPKSALVFFSGGGETKEDLRKDRQWTKERFGNMSTSVFFDESEDHFLSLKAIGLCDAIVVAHSTFSWWAAYLSDTLEVIAPYHYFTPHLEVEKKYAMEDFLLPWWTVLSSNSSEDRIVGWNPSAPI